MTPQNEPTGPADGPDFEDLVAELYDPETHNSPDDYRRAFHAVYTTGRLVGIDARVEVETLLGERIEQAEDRAHTAGLAEGRRAEREACAELVEEADVETSGGYHQYDDGRGTLTNAAAAIRARGQQ